MRKDVLEQIKKQKDLHEFIRIHPNWYRKLSRDPRDIYTMEIAALNFHEKTIPHQVQRFTNSVQMASMMMHMFANMKAQS